jgi:FemAB-related protein (PEP-CTERM system-associated)
MCGEMTNIEVTTQIDPAEWDAFLLRQPHVNCYQQWGWRRIFEDAFGHSTVYLAAQDGGEIVGVLPLVIFRSRVFGRFAVSLPFVDGGGVCAIDSRIAKLLVDRATSIANELGLSHIELRHVTRQFPAIPERHHKVGMQLPLATTATAAWTALDRKVRNQVRKAEKSGLVTRSGGGELVDHFYHVFARNMRDLGIPVYPRKLFESAVAAFPAATRVFVVDHGERVVAAGISLRDRDRLTVPWASSLREYRTLCPNNLLYWRMIEHAIGNEIPIFDFGRSTPGEGTYQFKSQWGAQATPIHWEYVLLGRATVPDRSPSNARFRTAIATWKRLPVPLTSWLGPRLVRAFP